MFIQKSVLSLRLGMAVVAAGTLAAAPARAEIPSVGKVAMVDLNQVLNETHAGKRARKDLEASMKVKQQQVQKKQTKLQEDAAKAQNLKGAQLQAAAERHEQGLRELQNMMLTLEQEFAEENNKLLEKMYRNAQSIVAEMAKTDGLDLVLVRDQMTIIYTKESLDITSEVIKRYNKKHK
jgi:outer membrane protein